MEIALTYLAFVIIGAGAGILSGLLGIGGGVVTVPCLLLLFKLTGYPQPYVMQLTIATSLAAMVFTTAASTWAFNKRHYVLWDVFKRMAPGIAVGTILGAILGVWLSGILLQVIFGFFLCALAVYFYRKTAIKTGTHKMPHMGKISFFSGGIGLLSSLLGIGGGSLTVPLLTAFKISDKNAIGTSAAATLLTTALGTLAYWTFGLREGLINLPAVFVVGIASLLLAPYGTKLAHELPPEKVRKIFAIVLALTGLSLIFL